MVAKHLPFLCLSDLHKACYVINICTVEPRLSGPRLSGLFDHPDFFSSPVFFMNINKLSSQKLSEVKNA